MYFFKDSYHLVSLVSNKRHRQRQTKSNSFSLTRSPEKTKYQLNLESYYEEPASDETILVSELHEEKSALKKLEKIQASTEFEPVSPWYYSSSD